MLETTGTRRTDKERDFDKKYLEGMINETQRLLDRALEKEDYWHDCAGNLLQSLADFKKLLKDN